MTHQSERTLISNDPTYLPTNAGQLSLSPELELNGPPKKNSIEEIEHNNSFMMKCFYLLLLVAATQARVARDAKDLPAPTLVRLTALDGPAFSVEWTPVRSPDSSDPVLGYKVGLIFVNKLLTVQ